MTAFKAPLRDMRFALHEVLDVSSHYAAIGRSDLNAELVDAVLEEGGRFTAGVLAPLNRSGDEEGVTFNNGEVKTPDGFPEAYRQFCENGWASMTGPEEYGGQGLPVSMAAPFHEMMMAANLSFRVYSGLTEGAVLALTKHGSEALKDAYLPKLVSGEWLGTMCLTEPHAGTDLALLRTKAEPQVDGSYAVSGTKIFISGGEQDMSSNIIHLVLARLPDAPAGVKGISLFLVPKFLPTDAGEPGERNPAVCGSVEHKMGIKAAATCVMNFDSAKGWLIGDENKGLACMFTMMNDARFQVGLQGLGIGEMAYQGAVEYALERLQSRALSGPQHPELAADPIIVHPDVRRMLLTQKTLVEGCRVLAYDAALALDIEHFHDDAAERKLAGTRAALLIPIVKSFLTDMSAEAANIGMQVYGGHGFIREWGMEQLVRDGRITQIYEGTNGIQSLDLLRRKVMGDQGAELTRLQDEIDAFCQQQESNVALASLLTPLLSVNAHWRSLAADIMQRSAQNPEEIGGCATDFMQFSAYALLAYAWARMATVAAKRAQENPEDVEFYQAKIASARFYAERILPRADMHRQVLQTPVDSLFGLTAEQFVR
ncbi:MAG: acyl-CoA dehydrogenase C-terminal domain-containing protein [Thalassolituus sp.]|uniref:acyl-CoA dehydrogenase C-terminal domain-containing protein n=1 Tax=Thalassolituus sp. TaxID=2030822 RepID=UPI0039822510